MKNDRMPDRNDSEFDAYAERLLKLEPRDFFELFDIVGVAFPSRYDRSKRATFDELKGDSREDLVDIFDEADSRQKVEDYLRSKGV